MVPVLTCSSPAGGSEEHLQGRQAGCHLANACKIEWADSAASRTARDFVQLDRLVHNWIGSWSTCTCVFGRPSNWAPIVLITGRACLPWATCPKARPASCGRKAPCLPANRASRASVDKKAAHTAHFAHLERGQTRVSQSRAPLESGSGRH